MRAGRTNVLVPEPEINRKADGDQKTRANDSGSRFHPSPIQCSVELAINPNILYRSEGIRH